MQTVLATLDGQSLLLAQPDIQATESTAAPGTPGTEGGTDGKEQPQGFNPLSMMLIFGAVILFMFMLGGGSRKQRKKQAQMLASMTKGDKVVTIGGIRGSVVEVRDNEIVVKVDENNNTRMKFNRDAIREIISDKEVVEDK